MNLKLIRSYEGQFQIIMKQEDRLILDDKVFNINTGDFVTEIEKAEELMGGIQLSDTHILISH